MIVSRLRLGLEGFTSRLGLEVYPAGNGDSRIKKWGGHCGAKEKVRGANINVYLAW